MNPVKTSTCLFPFVLSCLFSCAQGITGVWKGDLHVQSAELPIVFHIGSDSSGKLIAVFDSPSQKAFNLPVSEVMVRKDSVILMIAMLNGKYAGSLSQDRKTIDGTWFQGKLSLPLTVKKISDTATVKQQRRPQTPEPPFPYRVKDVEYWNADKSIRYGGTMTYPMADPANPGKNKFPAVVLITGSGQQDRDETLLEHKPFAVIADNLTKKGFLVLRVDDRGMGKTTGDFGDATSLDFAKDVEAGLDFLETQPETDKQKIGLIGHSEGGLIAPIVADERKDVKFIILLAGPGIPTIDLLQQQSEAIDMSVGRTPVEARATSELLRIIWEEINKHLDSASTWRNITTRSEVWARAVDTATLAKIKARFGVPLPDYLKQALAAMNSKWFRYFISFNPQPYLQNLRCKVLALGGSKDVQVVAKTNLQGIRTSLQKSHSPKYDVIELAGLNHLFQTCHRCSPDEYGDLEESFSPTALAVMDDWLAKNVQ